MFLSPEERITHCLLQNPTLCRVLSFRSLSLSPQETIACKGKFCSFLTPEIREKSSCRVPFSAVVQNHSRPGDWIREEQRTTQKSNTGFTLPPSWMSMCTRVTLTVPQKIFVGKKLDEEKGTIIAILRLFEEKRKIAQRGSDKFKAQNPSLSWSLATQSLISENNLCSKNAKALIFQSRGLKIIKSNIEEHPSTKIYCHLPAEEGRVARDAKYPTELGHDINPC